MPRPIPIYKDHDEIYRADSCKPLIESLHDMRIGALRHGHYPGVALPDDALPQLKMAGYWDTDLDQNWGLPPHRNEGLEITFLERGSLAFGVDGQEFLLKPGDLTITRPWQLHHVGAPNVTASRLHWLILDLSVRRPHQQWAWPNWLLLSRSDVLELTSILRQNERPVWRANSEFRHCFAAISAAVEMEHTATAISRLAVRINDLFLTLLELLRGQKVALDASLTTSQRTVELFLKDLRENPEHLACEWSVGEMARSCGLGRSQFVQHVSHLTNMTPAHYVTHCRLELAARLLRQQPPASITEVALTCGFSSSQYFATVFTRWFGCSPREFRDGAAQQQQQAARVAVPAHV